MKKQIWLLLTICVFASLSFFTIKQNHTMSDFDTSDYDKAWGIVDSLEQKGLPASALKHVEAILNRAKRENNVAQLIKAILYRGKFQIQLEEDGLVKAIERIDEEIDLATFPAKPLLLSIEAELYARYLRDNQWQLRDRTETANFDAKDMQTWTIRQLTDKSRALYLASVADAQSKKLAIEDFSAITGEGVNAANLRPTLFDLLAHRAIDHFQNELNNVTEPAYKFYIDQASAFAPASDFVNNKFEAKETTSAKYQNLLLLQQVLSRHLPDKDPAALIDVDLKRLKFVYDNAVLMNKEDLYLAALKHLAGKYEREAAYAEIIYQLATLYQQKGQNYQPNPEHIGKDDRKIAYDLCKKAVEKYPNTYGAANCKNLMTSLSRKELGLQIEQVNAPNQTMLASLDFRNVANVHVKVLQLGYEEQSELLTKPTKEIVQELNKKPALSSKVLNLPVEGDYHTHRTEFDLDGLPLGSYAVMVADNADFSGEGKAVGYAFIHISNLAFWSRSTMEGEAELVVMDRTTGMPIQGVIAELFARKYDSFSRKNVYEQLATLKSDQQGFIRPSVSSREQFKVKLIHGTDVLYLEDAFSSYSYGRQERPATTHTHFFLDRAIYRPGQTLYFKGIVIQKESDAMPNTRTNTAVEVRLLDVNRQEVAKLNLTTNEYGTISGTFTTPKTGLLGQMSLEASVGGTHYFRVEEYKRPKFEVTYEPVEGAYKLGDEILIKGKALAFAGNSIDGSEVKYRIVRQVRFPYLRYWSYRYNPYQRPETEIANGLTTTDADGFFEIRFNALADLSVPADKKPEFTYRIYADVTDITGETQSNETNISVGYIALSADIIVPEKIDKDAAKALKIVTQNLAGQFEAAEGTISIVALRTPEQVYKNRLWELPDTYLLKEAVFKQKFKDYPYKEEGDIQSWAVKEKVYDQAFNTKEQKELSLPLKKWDAGQYRLTLNTADKYGQVIEIVKYFEIFDLDKKSIAVNSPAWLYHPDKTFEPGEDAAIYIGSTLAPVHVLIEIEKQGKIVKQYWEQVKGIEKVAFPVKEEDRGNFHYHISFTRNERSYTFTKTILVPWSNKDLSIKYATFRDKLLPGQDEEWQIKIKGPKGEKIAAEMVAGMYDASLDQFSPNNWLLDIYPIDTYSRFSWQLRGFDAVTARLYAKDWQATYQSIDARIYPYLNWFGFSAYPELYGVARGGRTRMTMKSFSRSSEDNMAMSAPRTAEPPMEVQEMAVVASAAAVEYSDSEQATLPKEEQRSKLDPVEPIRTNLKETVFFMPDLRTDAEGNIILKFKMNEALTRWKFLGLAHTKDLKFATTQKEIVTQKELMVSPNPPRFFREGDAMEFTAKVSNLSDRALTGMAEIELLDALTMQPINTILGIDKQSVPFTVLPGQSAPLSWKIKVPIGKVNAVTHRISCKAGSFSDGEESTLPVLSNRMLVTESKPLALRSKETKIFTLESLKAMKGAESLQPHQYTLEFTSNPAWYAVQALPYLMEYPYDCTEQVFSRFYANTLASTVANAHPKIKSIFDAWKATDSDALKSNLSKNQELKTALLEETPWVLNAQSEEEQKRNIGVLFDLNRMADEQATAMAKIKERQLSNGGFPWFPGGRDNWYITQHLVEGMGHLRQLKAYDFGIETGTDEMLAQALRYLDARAVETYEELKKTEKVNLKEDHLSNLMIHYLYTRSFFMDTKLEASTQKAFDYYTGQAEQYWLGKGVYQEGMIGLALNRINKSAVTSDIIKSLKERAIKSDELGMYWKQAGGYYWYQLPMETHAIMIELFEEVAQDKEAVNELKIWLLKNKQTNHWKTTKATSAVVYALLMSGDNWLMNSQAVEVSLGAGINYQAQIAKAQSTPEAGTGYFKTSWKGEAVKADMATIKVSNPNEQPAWGAVYWQYFEDLDKIKTFEETPLTIRKQLFKESNSDKGPVITPISGKEKLTPGDKIKVRIEIRVDRAMEYVHLKDTRAAGFEPINVLSAYKWQGGLGYYESTKDAATNFFIDYLPKGTYVFEYPLRVVHKGDFSNGITSMQCMYAPEFSSHSEGIRVQVE